MAFTWQTVEQAAVTLKISTRTIARRIAKGEIESRLNSGRREVYIDIPSAPEVEATLEGELQPDPVYEQTVRQTVTANAAPGTDVETTTALILAEDRARRAEMAITVIQQSTAIVREEVYRARSGARWAWGIVAAMAACVMVAVGWTTTNVTKNQQQADSLKERMAQVNETSEKLEQERNDLAAQLTKVREASARFEGQLQELRSDAEATRAQLAAAKDLAAREAGAREAAAKISPTTKPSSFAHRLAEAVLGD
jgi:hypothetical protein